MNLNHIHLHVTSVERAADFYERYFGMRQHVWHGEMVFMRDEAGMDLALAPGEVARMPDWFHIGFRLGGRPAVEALCRRLEDDGAPIKAPFTADGDFCFFRCADPDGHLIEVYYEPEPV
jgi:catechol 2,3-dioxygenase-like lactoylglutathione lyase family enzyme